MQHLPVQLAWGGHRQLEKIAALVDWAAFERLLGDVYAAPVGRPSYGPVVLMKCLLLQQWYRLSDPGFEEALADRLSFRRFVGLALADPVPDHSTLSRFSSELSRRGLAERLRTELNRPLDARGLMVKAGTLIDASLVAAGGRRRGAGRPGPAPPRPAAGGGRGGWVGGGPPRARPGAGGGGRGGGPEAGGGAGAPIARLKVVPGQWDEHRVRKLITGEV
jgi:transposase, IS5 family